MVALWLRLVSVDSNSWPPEYVNVKRNSTNSKNAADIPFTSDGSGDVVNLLLGFNKDDDLALSFGADFSQQVRKPEPVKILEFIRLKSSIHSLGWLFMFLANINNLPDVVVGSG
jgi:hypothetical protein